MSRLGPPSFLTSLLSELGTYDPKPEELQAKTTSGLYPSVPFNQFLASPEATRFFKPILTTLLLFFPNELLPALDLLDRGLVSRLIRLRDAIDSDLSNEDTAKESFYIVRSSTLINRGQSYASFRPDQDERLQARTRNLSYEVRLTAWNCTCPAFVFDMISELGTNNAWETEDHVQGARKNAGVNSVWPYGGLRRMDLPGKGERAVPNCKHLLACLLVERCPALRQYVDEKEMSAEEIAGWTAGWGD